MASTNYGIKYCQSVIKALENIENRMFDTLGHGFDKYSKENMTCIEYKRLLAKFKLEREHGMPPSYKPSIHGSFNQ